MWPAENIIQSMWPAVHRWFPTPVLDHQSGFPDDKTHSAKRKKTCKLNFNPLDKKNYQRSLRFGLGSTYCRV